MIRADRERLRARQLACRGERLRRLRNQERAVRDRRDAGRRSAHAARRSWDLHLFGDARHLDADEGLTHADEHRDRPRRQHEYLGGRAVQRRVCVPGCDRDGAARLVLRPQDGSGDGKRHGWRRAGLGSLVGRRRRVGSAVSAAPYTFQWDTTKVADGSHTVAVTVTDSLSGTATSARSARDRRQHAAERRSCSSRPRTRGSAARRRSRYRRRTPTGSSRSSSRSTVPRSARF